MKNKKKWFTLNALHVMNMKVQKHLVDPNRGQSNIKSIYIYIYMRTTNNVSFFNKLCHIFNKKTWENMEKMWKF